MVHAALWLVVTLGAVAGIYLVLAAEFVAWVQVLIYVGAVVVLLLFALMLTRAPTGRQEDLNLRRVVPAATVAALVAVLLGTTVVAGFHDVRIDLGHAGSGPRRGPGRRCSPCGCCRSRCSACCCSRRWSEPSCCPGSARTVTTDAAVVAAAARQPAVLDRRLRRAGAPERGAGAD